MGDWRELVIGRITINQLAPDEGDLRAWRGEAPRPPDDDASSDNEADAEDDAKARAATPLSSSGAAAEFAAALAASPFGAKGGKVIQVHDLTLSNFDVPASGGDDHAPDGNDDENHDAAAPASSPAPSASGGLRQRPSSLFKVGSPVDRFPWIDGRGHRRIRLIGSRHLNEVCRSFIPTVVVVVSRALFKRSSSFFQSAPKDGDDAAGRPSSAAKKAKHPRKDGKGGPNGATTHLLEVRKWQCVSSFVSEGGCWFLHTNRRSDRPHSSSFLSSMRVGSGSVSSFVSEGGCWFLHTNRRSDRPHSSSFLSSIRDPEAARRPRDRDELGRRARHVGAVRAALRRGRDGHALEVGTTLVTTFVTTFVCRSRRLEAAAAGRSRVPTTMESPPALLPATISRARARARVRGGGTTARSATSTSRRSCRPRSRCSCPSCRARSP